MAKLDTVKQIKREVISIHRADVKNEENDSSRWVSGGKYEREHDKIVARCVAVQEAMGATPAEMKAGGFADTDRIVEFFGEWFEEAVVLSDGSWC